MQARIQAGDDGHLIDWLNLSCLVVSYIQANRLNLSCLVISYV